MAQLIFHLIGNAHLDPVWMWDWREGLNEGLITHRTILDLMDEDGELTFMRGEAAQYEHLERHAPDLFERICTYVKANRWDVVGGTYVQPDKNLPSTEVLLKHFMLSQEYFVSRFGKPARVAWAADSFGHSAGLPEVLVAAGMSGFAFTRPQPSTCAATSSRKASKRRCNPEKTTVTSGCEADHARMSARLRRDGPPP